MRQLFEKLTASALILGGVALMPRQAEACGGFFCSQQQPVNQAAEGIIFADNGDGTITAVIQIMYEGPAENFSWLLPISTVPEAGDLAVASNLAFSRLQSATNPQFNLNVRVEGTCRSSSDFNEAAAAGPVSPERESCEDNALLAGCGASGNDAVAVAASGVVGAFDWAVISVDPAVPDPAVPALEWLTDNGYDVTPEGAALVGPYLAEGMNLLALRLTKGSDTGSIRPIRLTYPAAAPMIPIKLTAVAANRDMGVMTWALAKTRAVPFNYNALELNEARVNWFNAASNYGDVVNEAANDAGGNGFVTEFAGPSALLADVVWPQTEESDWQSVRAATYSSFEEMLQAASGRYQGYDGFWDAVRRSVDLDEDLSPEDFRLCPWCYTDQVSFSPSEFFAAIEADVIEPLRSVQALIDAAPYTTRLYTTLSAEEMTIDPVFVFNPDLPDVNNIHQTDRVIECSSDVFEWEAPWRIDFPQGTTIRGNATNVGVWPLEVDEQPANFQVLVLANAGAGEVVEDNGELIGEMLGAYNDSLPEPTSGRGSGSLGGRTRMIDGGSGGLCTLPSRGPVGTPVPVALGLAALLGASWLRRRR
jgi:hypothetical protein